MINKYQEISQFSTEAHKISIHYFYAYTPLNITASWGYFQVFLAFQ